MCGFDAHTCVKGRKRHILVDTLGLLLAVYVTPADLHDGKGARCLLTGLAPLHLRLPQDLGRCGVPWTGVGCLVPSGRWLQYVTQTMGGGANTLLGFPATDV